MDVSSVLQRCKDVRSAISPDAFHSDHLPLERLVCLPDNNEGVSLRVNGEGSTLKSEPR